MSDFHPSTDDLSADSAAASTLVPTGIRPTEVSAATSYAGASRQDSDEWYAGPSASPARRDEWYDFGQLASTRLAELLAEFRAALDQQLRPLERLRDGWDSYGARPIDPQTLGRARDFLLDLVTQVGRDRPHVFIAPTVQGGISLEWQSGPKELSVRFTPTEWVIDAFWANDETGTEQEFRWSPRQALRLIAEETAA